MKMIMKRLAGSMVLAGVMALGLGQAASAQVVRLASDPAQVLVAFERVAFGNAQDLDTALAMMSDDAVLTVTPPPPGTSGVWAGKAQIREALLYNKQHSVKRDNVGNPVVDGNKATTMSMVTNDFFLLWGVAPVEHSTSLVVEAGKIKSYTSAMSPSEQGRVGAAAKAYQAAHSATPAVQPAQQGGQNVGMPNTGGGEPITILAGLLVAGLFLVLGISIRGTRLRA